MEKVTVIFTCSSSSSAGKVKDNKEVAQPLKDFGLRISKLLVSVKTPTWFMKNVIPCFHLLHFMMI